MIAHCYRILSWIAYKISNEVNKMHILKVDIKQSKSFNKY